MEEKKTKSFYFVIDYLIRNSSNTKVVTIKDISASFVEIEKLSEKDKNIKRIENNFRNYLREMKDIKIFDVHSKRGKHGGWYIGEEFKHELISLATFAFSEKDKNAINDSFERSLTSSSYHYHDELINARNILYKIKNFKDNDREIYVGEKSQSKYKKILIRLKEAIKNNEIISISLKHDYYGLKAGLNELKLTWLIHDKDESYVVSYEKNKKRFPFYLNIKNIDKVFACSGKHFEEFDFNFSKHINDVTISSKPAIIVKFNIIAERGWSIFELWDHEFSNLSIFDNQVKLEFKEQYRFITFLARMQPYISNLEINGNGAKNAKKGWNEMVNSVHLI